MSNENIDEGVADEAKKHTAGHILFQSLKRTFPRMKIIKDIFKHDKTSMIVWYSKQPDWNAILEAERIANKIIAEDRKVNLIEVPKDEINKKFGDKVRGRWDLIKDDTVRIVEVDDFDYSACMGKHVQSTSKIGMIIITKIHSLGKGEYEIQYAVGEEAKAKALEMGKTAAEASETLGVELAKLRSVIEGMKTRIGSFEKSLRELSREVLKRVEGEYEDIKGVRFYSNIFEGFDRNEVGRRVAELIKGERTVAVFANIDGNKATISAGKSNDIAINLLPLVQDMCRKLGGNAGGRKSLIVGGCKADGLKGAFGELANGIKSKI